MSRTLTATTAAPAPEHAESPLGKAVKRQNRKLMPGKKALAAFAVAAALLLTGCGQGADAETDVKSASNQVEEGAFPVTIKHALGETTIKEEPKRVLVMDSESADTTLALGIVPVAFQEQSWGGDAQGYFPWTRKAVDKLVKETPKTSKFYSDTGDLNFEAILNQEPDLILAPYSGYSAEEYKRLSEIAPTIPYDNKPWQPSSWQQMTLSIGQALGRPAKAKELVSQTEAAIKSAKDSHTEFNGVSFIYGTYLREGETETAVYGPEDPRVKFIADLGLTVAPDVVEAAKKAGSDSFSFGVSLEKLDTLDADIYLGWASEQSEVDYTLKNPLFAKWPVIVKGKDLWMTDQALSSSTQRVSVLSIPWAIDTLLPQITAVIEKK